MVKFYSSTFTYDYSFPAVSLAYFLRYPNPYSTHVLSTDVIDRHYDPATQRLTTLRLHLKKSKMPAAVVNLLPRSMMGSTEKGDSQSFILEKSVVDIKEGTMETENRNLDWTAVLSVIENQVYRRRDGLPGDLATPDRTEVDTTVTLHSHVGENIRRRRARLAESSSSSGSDEEAPAKVGFFRSWTYGSMQRSIEMIGLRRAEGAQPKATLGMQVVLERHRHGGLVGVLEGMRKDRELMFASGVLSPSASDNQAPAVNLGYGEE